MGKNVSLILVCLFFLTIFGCTSFSKLDFKKVNTSETSEEETTPPPKSSGYLTSGSTVTVDTGDIRRKTTVLEEYKQTQEALVIAQDKIDSLQTELGRERELKAALERELKELKLQLEAAQQISVENEALKKQLSEIHTSYQKQIKELSVELATAQIEETKAKQALTSLKIEQLMENKK